MKAGPRSTHFIIEGVSTFSRRIRADDVGWFTNFYTYYVVGLILSGLIGGGIIAAQDGLPFLDGFYLAVSALTCTGLASVPMNILSTETFVVESILVIFGQSFMAMNIYLCVGRYLYSRRNSNVSTLKEKTVELTVWVMISYLVLWYVFGILSLIGALRVTPWNAELQSRHFTREAQALYLTVCAFGNAGYTLTSDSIYDLRDNPLAYTIVALIISAGCTLAPPFLRVYIHFLRWCRVHVLKITDVAEYDELLEHGDEYSTYLFNRRATMYIFKSTMTINAAQFFLYCFSELIRQDALDTYGSPAVLVGMGFFQAVSTRYAGFQIMDMRLLSNGMIVVYTFFMYIPPTWGVEDYMVSRDRERVNSSSEPTASSSATAKVAPSPGSRSPSASSGGSPASVKISPNSSPGSLGLNSADPEVGGLRVSESTESVKPALLGRAASTTLSIRSPTSGKWGVLRETFHKSTTQRRSSLGKREELSLSAALEQAFLKPQSIRRSMRFAKATLHDELLTWLGGFWGRTINTLKNHDMWILFSLLILSFTEDKLMKERPDVCNIWYIFFEVISAYGNVGLSMGVPYAPYSLSGEFSKMGYLVIIFVMYLGKHRGMPSVESAVVDFSHPALVEKAEKAGALAHAQASAQPGDSANSEAGEDYWNQASFREGSGRRLPLLPRGLLSSAL